MNNKAQKMKNILQIFFYRNKEKLFVFFNNKQKLVFPYLS